MKALYLRILVYLKKLRNLSGKKRAYVIAFGIFALVLLWAFFSAGFMTHDFTRSQIASEDKQEVNVKSMILTESKEGKKYWEIYGEEGTYSSDQKVALLTNVVGNFFDSDNEVAMSFESSQGTYNEEKEEIILYNNTYFVIKDGTSLKCDRLIWAGSDKDVIAEGNVKIIKNNEFYAEGKKVIISKDYSHFKLVGNTKSIMYDKNGKENNKKDKDNKEKSKGSIF